MLKKFGYIFRIMKNDSIIRKNPHVNKSVVKSLQVLKLFNLDTLVLSVTDVAKRTGMPISTSYRVLVSLAESGLLEYDKNTGRYAIGPEMHYLGSLYLKQNDIFQASAQVAEELNSLSKEAVSVATLDRGNIRYVFHQESTQILRLGLHIGSTIPAYSSAIGRALLAELSEEELDELYPEEDLLRLTSKTICTKRELKMELQQVREMGIAVDSEGTFEGVFGIGATIKRADGRAVAVLGMAIPAFRMNRQKQEFYSDFLRKGASVISYRLGYRNDAQPSISNIEKLRSWWIQESEIIK